MLKASTFYKEKLLFVPFKNLHFFVQNNVLVYECLYPKQIKVLCFFLQEIYINERLNLVELK